MGVGLKQVAAAAAPPRFVPKRAQKQKLYVLPRTETEFVEWCSEDTRAEFVDGEIIMHSPTSTRHGKVSRFLNTLLDWYINTKQLGELLGPNIQVRLRPGLRREPDLLFIAQERLEMIKKNHVEGAPDLVIEIVSPDSVERDWYTKHVEYENAGVREYWVIDPRYERLAMYTLSDAGKYETILPDEDDPEVWHSVALAGFWLRPQWLWQEPLPNVTAIAREMGLI